MLRKIVKINEEKCTGCGLCIDACHEGALQLINGKARLVSDSYCDGLGACLPECPADAINIIEREAAAFDEEAVKKHMETHQEPSCPSCTSAGSMQSQLGHWPCQIKLVPVNAPFLADADLLIAADCTAYAYANFHNDFIKDRVTLIGCPKLDNVDYTEKFAEMFRLNNIRSITAVRMTVPCCGGLVNKVNQAVMQSGRNIPVNVITIDPKGNIVG